MRTLLAAGMAAALAAAHQGPTAPAPLLVAALQANGSLIPFAAYDGTRWSNSWPEPDTNPDVAVTTLANLPRAWTAGAPIPSAWQLWLPTRTAHSLTVRAPRYVDSRCSRNWVLTTDFPPTATLSEGCPIRTIGVALSSSRMVDIPWPARGSAVPLSVIESEINVAEDAAIAASARDHGVTDGHLRYYGHPLDVSMRRATAIRIEHAWEIRSRSAPSLLYVEVVRQYAHRLAGDRCGGVTSYQAWLQPYAKPAPVVLAQQLELEDCDMKGVQFIEPLGALTLDGGRYVIVERTGWSSQDHGVIRIDGQAVVPVLMAPLR